MKLAALCFATLAALPARAVSPEGVPDPRPAHHVVDLTRSLKPAEIARIDAAAESGAAFGELLVVVVPSLGIGNARDWSKRVLNHLKPDQGARNRGVVFVVAMVDRKSGIAVGDGFPADVASITDEIVNDTVIDHIKDGNARGAIMEGSEEIAARVLRGEKPLVNRGTGALALVLLGLPLIVVAVLVFRVVSSRRGTKAPAAADTNRSA